MYLVNKVSYKVVFTEWLPGFGLEDFFLNFKWIFFFFVLVRMGGARFSTGAGKGKLINFSTFIRLSYERLLHFGFLFHEITFKNSFLSTSNLQKVPSPYCYTFM